MKTSGGLRKTRYRGRARVQLHAYLVAAASNLVRIARLAPAAT
jgi:IS5 family transposase